MSQPRRPPRDLFQDVWRDHEHRVLRLALSHFRPRSADLRDELVAAGMVGLWQAWKKYDPGVRSNGLWEFANSRVLGAMRDHLRQADLASRHERDLARLSGQQIPERQLVGLENVSALPDPLPSALEELSRTQVCENIREAVLSLRPRHSKILMLRYFDEKKLADLGRELGFTESRACQLEQAALAELREAVELDPRLAREIDELSC